MSISERRLELRVPVEMYLNQYVRERGFRALASNLSDNGLFMRKLTEPFLRRASSMALEFELPGTNEIIWARAEPRFESLGGDFHLTGVLFTAIADKHARLIRDYVQEKAWWEWKVEQLRRRQLTARSRTVRALA